METYILPCSNEDLEFVRLLRNSQKQSFIEQHEISSEEHASFMLKNMKNYYIIYALVLPKKEENYPKGGFTKRIGFVGIVDKNGFKDIRFAVDPEFQGKGIGTKLLQFIIKQFPEAVGKVSQQNIASNKTFKKAGFVLFIENEQFKYWVGRFDDPKIWEGVDKQ